MRRKQADVVHLAQTRDRYLAEVEHRKAELEAMRERIEVEYARHFPELEGFLSPDSFEMRLGNTPTSMTRVWCRTCRHEWPCEEWHAYRRIHGWDNSRYEIKFHRIEKEDE